MVKLALFLIAFLASSVGSIVGAGGGVIIKPVLDLTGLMTVSTASFCSGCTVLGMSLFSVIKGRNNGIRLEIRTSTLLAIGAVVGGLLGRELFDVVRTVYGNENVLGAIQSFFLMLTTLFVFLYLCKKKSFPSGNMSNAGLIVLTGFSLGLLSSFLGIGGGPVNVAVLFLFFGMDAKKAAKNSLYIIVFSQTASLVSALATHSVPEFEPVSLLVMIGGGIGGALLGGVISSKIKNSGVENILKALVIVIVGIAFYNMLNYTVL